MYKFKIKIANQIIEIETINIRPFAICRDFITYEEGYDLKLTITHEDIKYDNDLYMLLQRTENIPWVGMIEVYTLLRKLADIILDRNVFLMHGAAISINNQAIVFSGRSGVGKSTHILRWLENNRDTIVINGDKPFILTGDSPMVCSSPWGGKENVYTNINVPLKAIVFLERSDNNFMERVTFSDAFLSLLQQSHRPKDIMKMRKTIELLMTLENKVLFYRFHVNNFKEDCYQVAYDALVNTNSSLKNC